MVTDGLLEIARRTAADLRRRGEPECAQAIEALIDTVSARDVPVSEPVSDSVADLVGVDVQTLRQWVQEGRYTGYRIGPLPIPNEFVQEYVRRARTSLDLEAIPEAEVARLVAEGRRRESRVAAANRCPAPRARSWTRRRSSGSIDTGCRISPGVVTLTGSGALTSSPRWSECESSTASPAASRVRPIDSGSMTWFIYSAMC